MASKAFDAKLGGNHHRSYGKHIQALFAALNAVVGSLIPKRPEARHTVSNTGRHFQFEHEGEDFREFLESLPDAWVAVDDRGLIVLANSQIEKMFGYDRAELLGHPIEILVPEAARKQHVAHREGYQEHPHARPMASRHMNLAGRRKDGTEFPAEISLSPLHTPKGLLVTSIIRDVTERRQAEAQRAQLILEQAARAEAEKSLQQFHDLVQDLDAVVCEAELPGGQLRFVSNRALSLLGYPLERWLGSNRAWLEHVHPEDRWRVQRFLEDVAETGSPTIEYRGVTAEGRQLWLRMMVYVTRDERNQPSRLRGLIVDFTERKQAEEAMRLSEKLAATGRLAAALAHELNNPMGAVTNLLYLIEHHPSSGEQTRAYSQTAQHEMARLVHITRQMLAFYRESTAPLDVDIPELVKTTLELYRVQAREHGIELHLHPEPVPKVLAFPGELRQVFSNLLLNALEATGPGGRIEIKVSAWREWRNPKRNGVRVTIADSGNGIAVDHRQHIFEPFFSTKGENGTGLGLWVSDGIVRKHGGFIRAHSSTRAGHSGTAFSVFLPADNPLVASSGGQKTMAARQVG